MKTIQCGNPGGRSTPEELTVNTPTTQGQNISMQVGTVISLIDEMGKLTYDTYLSLGTLINLANKLELKEELLELHPNNNDDKEIQPSSVVDVLRFNLNRMDRNLTVITRVNDHLTNMVTGI